MKYLLLLFLFACTGHSSGDTAAIAEQPISKDFYGKLSDATLSIVDGSIEYDPTYYKIPYPDGDVPAGKGVCTDVVIRAYRKMGIDLQKEVHVDMKANFSKYPKAWGLSKPDTNIDHRRVPNLQVFFSRKGKSLPVTENAADYKPGDIVSWMLPSNRPHIGVVVSKKSASGRYKMVHNIGYGQNIDDCLFEYTITGHYRYNPTAE